MKVAGFFLLFILSCSLRPAYGFDLELTKEQKLVAANVGGALFITGWGLVNWDYGQRSLSFRNEEWFGHNTKEGGADKVGHFHSNYVLSHILSGLCEHWGYPKEKAALYGTLSSFGLMSYMEFGDSFSEFGFSYEDFLMNALGSYVGYIMYTHPELSRKIDFRIEYLPTLQEQDFFTDYERTKYLVALKLDGFDVIENEYLKYLELHLGYYARGYSEVNVRDERNLYVGIGINISRIFSKLSYKKTAKFFNYYQPPFSYLEFRKELND